MKKLFAVCLALCLFLTSCGSPATSEPSYEPGTTEAFVNGQVQEASSETSESASEEKESVASSEESVSSVQPETNELTSRIHVSEPELLYKDSELRFTMDGSLCTLRQEDGSILFWETANGSRTPPFLMFRGTAEDPFAKEEGTFEWDFGDVRHNLNSTLWVQNFYQYEDGTLIGFVHREDLADNNDEGTNNFWIGLGISEDGGYHWKYLGDVLGTMMNWKLKENQPNMGGVPYIVRDGYFYIYYNEYIGKSTRYISVARMSVEETLACAKEGKLPEVWKYTGDDWNGEPLEGYGTMVVPGSSDGYMDSHADATWCEPLGMYLMTVQTHGHGKLWMYLSEDGVHWNDRVLLDSEDSGIYMQPYSTFVGLEDSSDDFSTVGSHFYVYFTRKAIKAYGYDLIYRVEVTVDPA